MNDRGGIIPELIHLKNLIFYKHSQLADQALENPYGVRELMQPNQL